MKLKNSSTSSLKSNSWEAFSFPTCSISHSFLFFHFQTLKRQTVAFGRKYQPLCNGIKSECDPILGVNKFYGPNISFQEFEMFLLDFQIVWHTCFWESCSTNHILSHIYMIHNRATDMHITTFIGLIHTHWKLMVIVMDMCGYVDICVCFQHEIFGIFCYSMINEILAKCQYRGKRMKLRRMNKRWDSMWQYIFDPQFMKLLYFTF